MTTSDIISYTIAAIYSTLLIGCFIGFRNNMIKKHHLKQTNQYEKQRRVIKWRFRFYLTLCTATVIRIGTLIAAVIEGQSNRHVWTTDEDDFLWSFLASLASMLYFSAFSFIIWFFAHLAFHRQPATKALITPFLTTLNVAIYASTLSIAISSYATSSWSLLYEYELPLFAVCGWILALLFVLLSFKISFSIHREHRRTVDYLEYSRRVSATQSARKYRQSAGSPLIHSMDSRRAGFIPREQSLLSEHSVIRPPPEPLPPPTEAPTTPSVQNDPGQSTSKHVIPRLIKLSLLCALCWTLRGMYLMALRIWPSTDRTPFGIDEMSWMALFYCVTEYPPSLGALVLMIWKPRKRKDTTGGEEQNYPTAKHNGY